MIQMMIFLKQSLDCKSSDSLVAVQTAQPLGCTQVASVASARDASLDKSLVVPTPARSNRVKIHLSLDDISCEGVIDSLASHNFISGKFIETYDWKLQGKCHSEICRVANSRIR